MQQTLKYLIVFLVCCLSNISFAQTTGGIYFNYTNALNEYRENIPSNPMGFSFNILKKLGKERLSVGAELGVAMYATDKYEYLMPDGEFKGSLVELEEEDCFLNIQAVARYELNAEKFITPYIEGVVGTTSFFSTRYTVEELDDASVNNTVFHGTALRIGGGGGFLINLSDYISIDLNVIANRGTKTDYRSVEPDGIVARRSLEEGRKISRTDNLNFKAGFQFGF